MINKLGVGFILCILVFASCESGIKKTHHSNGKINETFKVVNDSMRHGEYTRHDESGKLIETSNYNQGQLDLTRILYHPDGNIHIEENYTLGNFHGPYNEYDSTGQLILTLNYVDNVISGTSKGYYASGSVKEEVTFVNNEEQGPFKEYHPNGKLWWEGTYRNGDNEYGLLQEYDSTGLLIKKMMCDTIGICRTIWKVNVGEIKIEALQ